MRRVARAVVSAPTYRYIQLTMFGLLVVAFVTSFGSGREGARALGFSFDWAYPLICDVMAGIATVIHSRVRTAPKMRSLMFRVVFGSMALSWVAQAVSHIKKVPPSQDWPAQGQYAWIVLVVLVAGLAPVAVNLLLYISDKLVDFETSQDKKAIEEASQIETPQVSQPPTVQPEPEFTEPPRLVIPLQPEPAPKPAAPKPVKVAATFTDLDVERLMRTERVPREIAEIMLETGCSRATAYRRHKKGAARVATAS